MDQAQRNPSDVMMKTGRNCDSQFLIQMSPCFVCVCVFSHSGMSNSFWPWWPVGPPDSSAHGIFQVKIRERIPTFYSRGSSWPREWTCLSCISCTGSELFTNCTTWEAKCLHVGIEERAWKMERQVIRGPCPDWCEVRVAVPQKNLRKL